MLHTQPVRHPGGQQVRCHFFLFFRAALCNIPFRHGDLRCCSCSLSGDYKPCIIVPVTASHGVFMTPQETIQSLPRWLRNKIYWI